ncbi:MAG: hypothetical protein QMD65_00600 [Patescibacteria group bacterium]|nr:hypothetical protein [Patescibacteria group bacterium]
MEVLENYKTHRPRDKFCLQRSSYEKELLTGAETTTWFKKEHSP